MKRLAGIAAAMLLTGLVAVPVALGADAADASGRVLISIDGDVTLPAGEQADVIVVVNGTATIAGDARTLVVVEGSATLTGAETETIVAIRSPVELGPGTVVTGDVMTFDSAVHLLGDAEVMGEVNDISASLFAVGMVLGPAILLFWIGFGLATIVAALLLAGLASRQVRMTERIISREPLLSVVVGLLGLVVFPIAAVILIVSVIGAPLGLAMLFQLWPLLAFIGYLVAAIWIGELLLGRLQTGQASERPYLAAVVGVVLLQLLGLVPVLGIIPVVASLFGFGALLILIGRILLSRPTGSVVTPPIAAPVGGQA
jgi:hypothetical protein